MAFRGWEAVLDGRISDAADVIVPLSYLQFISKLINYNRVAKEATRRFESQDLCWRGVGFSHGL
jgi:hypothetical protein